MTINLQPIEWDLQENEDSTKSIICKLDQLNVVLNDESQVNKFLCQVTQASKQYI